MKNQKLLESVADISYIAGEMKYFSGNSREDISNFILWGKQFENDNLNTNWDEVDYRLTIEKFTNQKIQEHVTIEHTASHLKL